MLKHFNDRENWKTKSVVDPDTGHHHLEYYFKRKKAFRIEINTPLARKLGGYALIEKDLRTVLGWLELIDKLEIKDRLPESPGVHILNEDHENDPLIKSLYLSSLVFYGKCFSECKGRKVKLEKSNLSSEYHKVHNSIIEMRNNYGAHSGEIKYEYVNIALVLNPKVKYRKESPSLVRELMQPEIMKELPEDIDFYALANHAREFVLNKLNTLNDLVFEKDINPHGIEYWYKKGKNS